MYKHLILCLYTFNVSHYHENLKISNYVVEMLLWKCFLLITESQVDDVPLNFLPDRRKKCIKLNCLNIYAFDIVTSPVTSFAILIIRSMLDETLKFLVFHLT